jgi:hypothetical protein
MPSPPRLFATFGFAGRYVVAYPSLPILRKGLLRGGALLAAPEFASTGV